LIWSLFYAYYGRFLTLAMVSCLVDYRHTVPCYGSYSTAIDD